MNKRPPTAIHARTRSRHFERMESDLGFKLMSLNSLWYPHYFAASGYYTMLGAGE